MKNIVKRILPEYVVSLIRNLILVKRLYPAYLYDLKRFYRYSGTDGHGDETKLIEKIITKYHIIEKGLTMPSSRLGFGKDVIIGLSSLCLEFSKKYDSKDEQYLHAIGVILEYKRFHEVNNFELNKDIIKAITKIEGLMSISPTQQLSFERDDFFQYKNSEFLTFSNSRMSVRNFDENEEISQETLDNVLNLAKNAPSACNRQTWRTYIITDKTSVGRVLEAQGGNRGFGHLANKVIIVAGEVGGFASPGERNQVFIDGGIYAMNLLYSLHYYNIGSCILNCSHSVEKDMKMREIIDIKQSEVFIAMIAIGVPPKNFKVAISKRYSIEHTNKYS